MWNVVQIHKKGSHIMETCHKLEEAERIVRRLNDEQWETPYVYRVVESKK